jgi:hypothetical protein
MSGFLTGQVHQILQDQQSATAEMAVASGVMKDAFLIIFNIIPSAEQPSQASAITGRILFARDTLQRYLQTMDDHASDIGAHGYNTPGFFQRHWVVQTNMTVTVPIHLIHKDPAVVLHAVEWKKGLQQMDGMYVIIAHMKTVLPGHAGRQHISMHAVADDPAQHYDLLVPQPSLRQLADVHTAAANYRIVNQFLDQSLTTLQYVDVMQIHLADCPLNTMFALLGPAACTPQHMLYNPSSGTHEWFLSMEQLAPLIGPHHNCIDEESNKKGYTNDISERHMLLIFGEADFVRKNTSLGPAQVRFKDVQVRLRVRKSHSKVVCIFSYFECLTKTVGALDGGQSVRLKTWQRDGTQIV